MSRLLTSALVLVLLSGLPVRAEGESASESAVDAAAQPVPAPPVDADSGWKKFIEVTGYLDSRFSFTRARTWGLLPTDDVPQVQELLEFNTQVKVKVRERSYLYSDLSLVGNIAGHYRGRDASGADVQLDDHKTAQAQPVVSLNEFYVSHDFAPQLNVLVGKKRIVWGSGLASNPTDLLNPPRDPTDPTFQRAGSWVAQVEAPFESMTFSLLFAPSVLETTNGLPTAFMVYPTWDKKDDLVHFQFAGRWYALIGDADVTLMAFYGNAANDAFRDKLRWGLSFSRYFFTDYELHFEALIQKGSSRDFIDSGCVASTVAALVCVQKGTAPLSKPLLDARDYYPKLLVGTKRQFSDDSMLVIEYLYQSDGWSQSQMQDFANGLGLLDEGRRAGLPVNRIPGASQLLGQSSSSGLPTRFAFDPKGQHYLFLTFQKPRIFDDFTASLVVLANLTDWSTTWTPSIAWSATEWLTLSLYGFIPLMGPDSMAVKTPSGVPVTEFGITPFAARVMFEARAFF